MESLTIDIKNPKAKELLKNLADLDLISIRPPKNSWAVRWQTLSDTLPNIEEVSEQEIQDEVQAVRVARAGKR